MKVIVREIFCMKWELGRKIDWDENKSFSITILLASGDYNHYESGENRQN